MHEEITRKLRSLGSFANSVIPSRLNRFDLEPCRQDAIDFQDDLTALASKVDDVLLAYGNYLRDNGIVTDRDVMDHFTNTLSNALDGNAMWCIESGINERISTVRDNLEVAR